MTVLVFADHNNVELNSGTLNTITAAQLGDVDVIVAGSSCRVVAEQVATVTGVNKVLSGRWPHYATPLAETVAPLLQSISDRYSHILGPATTVGKNIIPRLPRLLMSNNSRTYLGLSMKTRLSGPFMRAMP